MFNIPLYENEIIAAWTEETQSAIVVQDKATRKFLRLVEGDEADTFRRYASIAGLIEQIHQRTAAEKAQLDAKAEQDINITISESNMYFNGFIV